MRQSSRRIHFRAIFIVLVFMVVLIACQSNRIISGLPTPYDLTPPTQTNTPCPDVRIDPSGFAAGKPVFIVISIENTLPGSRTWVYESQAYEIVSKALEIAAEPGDSVVIFRLGPLNFRDALVFDGRVGNVSKPNIPPTLTPVPSITATNTPLVTPEEGIFKRSTEAAATATQGVVELTATQIDAINRCGQEAWKERYSTVATEWAVTRNAAKNDFDSQLTLAPTPIPADQEKYGNQVFEGLQHATLAFNAECDKNKYRRCILIIFSDLSEYRTAQPDYFDPPVNLKNVEVLSVLLNCPVLYDPACKTTVTLWQNIFDSLGASNSAFVNGDNIENNLIDFIRR